MDTGEVNVFLSELLSGRYRPMRFIDSGHFSGTFQAEDIVAQGDVAAKILKIGHSATPEAIEEFRGEIALLKKLERCDRVVRLLDTASTCFISPTLRAAAPSRCRASTPSSSSPSHRSRSCCCGGPASAGSTVSASIATW